MPFPLFPLGNINRKTCYALSVQFSIVERYVGNLGQTEDDDTVRAAVCTVKYSADIFFAIPFRFDQKETAPAGEFNAGTGV